MWKGTKERPRTPCASPCCPCSAKPHLAWPPRLWLCVLRQATGLAVGCKLRIVGLLQVSRPNSVANFPGWVPQQRGSLGLAQQDSRECSLETRSQKASRWAGARSKEAVTMVYDCEASSRDRAPLQTLKPSSLNQSSESRGGFTNLW